MKSRLSLLLPIVFGVFFLDQLTKYWINTRLSIGDSIPVISGYFDIVHVRNRGAAFGFLASFPDSFRVPFFFVVSVVALTLITYYFFRLKDPRAGIYIGLAMVLGGAFGNIADRVRLGEVVDFLSFHWRDEFTTWHIGSKIFFMRLQWPAFNVADVSISCAVVLLMILMFKTPKSE